MGVTIAQAGTNLQTLTAKFQALQGPAQSISIVNGPLIVIGQGPFPQIITGLADIISTATTIINQMNGSEDTKVEQEAKILLVHDVTLVAVVQQTLNILIGKSGLFVTVPFIGQPVAAVLRSLEGVLDALQYSLGDTYKAVASDINTQTSSLSITIASAIQAYQGIVTI